MEQDYHQQFLAPKNEAKDILKEKPWRSIKEVAEKITNANGKPFGQNSLFQFLREQGVLYDDSHKHNLPLHMFLKDGGFSVKEATRKTNYGDRNFYLTRVSPRGVAFIQWLVDEATQEELYKKIKGKHEKFQKITGNLKNVASANTN